jgi:hypothetical protein
MARLLIVAALSFVIGAALEHGITRLVSQRHQHTRAVMWLSQFHLDNASAAARANQCERLGAEGVSLGHDYEELVQAFPEAYGRDSEFRARADALKSAVQMSGAAALDCADPGATVKRIHDACDDCHRQYRD